MDESNSLWFEILMKQNDVFTNVCIRKIQKELFSTLIIKTVSKRIQS